MLTPTRFLLKVIVGSNTQTALALFRRLLFRCRLRVPLRAPRGALLDSRGRHMAKRGVLRQGVIRVGVFCSSNACRAFEPWTNLSTLQLNMFTKYRTYNFLRCFARVLLINRSCQLYRLYCNRLILTRRLFYSISTMRTSRV